MMTSRRFQNSPAVSAPAAANLKDRGAGDGIVHGVCVSAYWTLVHSAPPLGAA